MTPSPEEVRRITAVEAPALRNLQITECYWRLAAAMGERAPGGANWCTFATWASRQAGRTIRGEDTLEHLRAELGRDAELLHPIASLWRVLLRHGLLDRTSRVGRFTAALHTPFDAIELASDAVARGNRKVFEEIGFEFARYLHAPDFDAFAATLPEPLRQPFVHYEQARGTDDPKARTELCLLANLEIGLHEQTRLQPEILEALDAATSSAGPLWRRILGWPLQRKLSRLSREVITRSLMVLTLPGTVLALGRHLDAPYPEALVALSSPELERLLARFEPVPPALDDCGARDWSELNQRMHYIVHLFRAFHERDDLASPPFTPEQVERLRSGRLPDGVL
jgi:hypothetical protein